MAIRKKFFGVNPDERENPPTGLRGTGVEGGKGIFDEYFNQMLFETQADHIIDTEANVKLATDPTGTCYYNSTSTEFQDRNDVAATFLDGDRIVWRGLDAIAANIDISTIDGLEHIMFQGVTIALGIYDLDLGENQRGEIDLSGTGTTTVLSSDGLRIKTDGVLIVDVQLGDAIINNVVPSVRVEFETSSDLKLNYISNTEAQASFSRMSLLDSNYIPKFLINETLIWDITTPGVLEPGTAEKSSTIYGTWVDSDKNLVLAPDIEGTCSSTVSGFLVDNTETLLTDLIHAGDILYNLTTKVKTTASADAAAEDRVAVTASIFTSGDLYKIVKMSPVGLGANRERLGDVFNNSGSNFDDSHYTQIQERKYYSEGAGDFVISGGTFSTSGAYISVFQENDWTGSGKWKISLQLAGSTSPVGSLTITITGVPNAIFTQALYLTPGTAANYGEYGLAGSGTILGRTIVNTSAWYISGDYSIISKPTFHD